MVVIEGSLQHAHQHSANDPPCHMTGVAGSNTRPLKSQSPQHLSPPPTIRFELSPPLSFPTMSHQRSKSTSSLAGSESPAAASSTNTAPLSISIPRQRSMSMSLGLATSPIALSGSSVLPNPSNPLLSPIVSSSPHSATPSAPGFGTTPPTSLSGFSNSIPTSIQRRFSASFTNPLNSHTPVGTASNATVGAQVEERGRRSSLFGTSPTATRHATSYSDHTSDHTTGMGIGGLFRKFSVNGRSGQHPLDSNEAGPPPAAPHTSHGHGAGTSAGMNLPSNATEHNSMQARTFPLVHPHLSTVDALKSSQKDKDSRSSSPMRSMILNGQMLD
ncbi:hypothetical protein B0O80DRAFT_81581 [Mortierella sp. GBAus27b]|nr:hypothetical protein B0O80DRAFT_81581 [Mortierella sp. GBAus27b]